MPDPSVAQTAQGAAYDRPGPRPPAPAPAPGRPSADDRAVSLLEAGLDGDLRSWEEGLALACGVRLTDERRRRLLAAGGPLPHEVERVLRGLGTPSRPRAHLARLGTLVSRYRDALAGDRDALRWLETVLGREPGSLWRTDLLGPDGLPLRIGALQAGLVEGPLPLGWLTRLRATLAVVCGAPARVLPVWQELGVPTTTGTLSARA